MPRQKLHTYSRIYMLADIGNYDSYIIAFKYLFETYSYLSDDFYIQVTWVKLRMLNSLLGGW